MSKTSDEPRPAPPLRAPAPVSTPAPAPALEVKLGAPVKVWPHLGDRGCFCGPHKGVITKVHMGDCVDVAATVGEGDREFLRTFVGVVLAGCRGREVGDSGTFTVVG